jgi:hypothetical protein
MSCFMQREIPGYLWQTCAMGTLFPYAMLSKLKKKRNLKASRLHIVLIFVLGGQSAKFMSEFLRGGLAGSTEELRKPERR